MYWVDYNIFVILAILNTYIWKTYVWIIW
jgi:hypothetical protein